MSFNKYDIEEIIFRVTSLSLEQAVIEGAELLKKGYHIDSIRRLKTPTICTNLLIEPNLEITFKLESGRYK